MMTTHLDRGVGALAAIAATLMMTLAAAPAAAQDEPPAPGESVELPDGVTAEMVDAGRSLFGAEGNCWACHGRNAAGTQLAPDLTDDEWLNIDGEYASIVELITTGVDEPVEHAAPMPPLGGAQLDDEQVRALAAYLYALTHGDPDA